MRQANFTVLARRTTWQSLGSSAHQEPATPVRAAHRGHAGRGEPRLPTRATMVEHPNGRGALGHREGDVDRAGGRRAVLERVGHGLGGRGQDTAG